MTQGTSEAPQGGKPEVNPALAAAAHDAHEGEHDGHGHGHGQYPFLQHHFDTPQQQFDAGKLGIWLFLGQEVLFFAGLFCAYTIYRSQNPEIFAFSHYYLDTKLGALNTIVLILSSVTAAWAVRCAQLNQQRGLIINIVVTIACAFTFMGVKYIEYSHKFHDGLLWGKNFDPKHPVWEVESFRNQHPRAALLAEEIASAAAKSGATAAAAPAAAAAVPEAPAAPAPAGDAPAGAAQPEPDPAATAELRPPTTAEQQQGKPPAGTESAAADRRAAELKRSAQAGPGAAAEAAATGATGKKVAEGTDPSFAARQAQPAPTAEPAQAAPTAGGAAQPAAATAAAAAPATAGVPEAAAGVSLVGRDVEEEIAPLVEAGLIGENSKVVDSIAPPKKAHIFFGIYFFMTGLHGLHVLAGIIVWVWLLRRAFKGQFGKDYFGPIDYAALYWHLVDLIWIYLFPLLYLID